MVPISITPLTDKQFKESFGSTIQYTFMIKNEAHNETEVKITRNIHVLHRVNYLEALLIWKSTFYDLSNDYQWTPTEQFRHVSLQLSDVAKDIWNDCMEQVMKQQQQENGSDDHVAEDKKHDDDIEDEQRIPSLSLLWNPNVVYTEQQFNETMSLFTYQFCKPSEAMEIKSSFYTPTYKKPYHMPIRTYVSRIEQINRYLPFLPNFLDDHDNNNSIYNARLKLKLKDLYYIIKQNIPYDIELYDDNIYLRIHPVTNGYIRSCLRKLIAHVEEIEEKKQKDNERRRRR